MSREKRNRLLPLFFLLWSVVLCLWRGFALSAEDQEDQGAYFEAAAREMGVPPTLTRAIAHVESRGRPWTLNVAGKSLFFDSKEEALIAARQAEASGQSFDSGLMQINNWWLTRYGIPLETALDPAANILLGSWILKQELDRAGDTWTAVGRYHSPNATRGERYADQVRRVLQRGPLPEAGDSRSSAPKAATTRRRLAAVRPVDPVAAGSPLLAYRRGGGAERAEAAERTEQTGKTVFTRTGPETGDPEQPFVRRRRMP